MSWFKVDDKMHSHRKTRRLLRSDKAKRRDAAPLGLWTAAGSWCSDNLTDGFIPTDELDTWDDDALVLAARLVDAGLWLEETLDGEPGFRFKDWSVRNPDAASVLAKRDKESEGGRLGNHVRWHQKNSIVVPECEFCTPKPSGTRSGTPSGDGSGPGQGTRLPGESSRPGPSRPAAAAAAGAGNAAAAPVDNSKPIDLPPAVEILRTTLEAHRLTVRWDKLTSEQVAEIATLVDLHGDGPLVKTALAKFRPDRPAAFAQAWLGDWRAIPVPGTTLRAVPAPECPAPGHSGTTQHCTQCAGEQKAAR